MTKIFVLTSYLVIWASIAAAMTWGIVSAGYSVWLGLFLGNLLFVSLSGLVSYCANALKAEGKLPQRYFQFLPLIGLPKFREEAPRSTHVLASVPAALIGTFLIYCGIGLVYDAQWSRIPHPMVVSSICLGLVGLGAALLFLAWRLIAPTR